jgi:methoxymalonate biosynthesis acyl carrier protein
VENIEKGVTERIRSFLQESLQVGEISEGDDIFTSGLANSLFALKLVSFIETEFSCRVENGDLTMENFRSIASLRRLVLVKRA